MAIRIWKQNKARDLPKEQLLKKEEKPEKFIGINKRKKVNEKLDKTTSN